MDRLKTIESMHKGSAVTARSGPAARGALTGTVVLHADSLVVETTDRVELVDLTDRLMAMARLSGVREGMASVWSMHTTCALFINEAQKALHADIKRLLEQMVARDGGWMHNDPQHSDCDRMNADAHLRATLLGHSVTLQMSGGEVVLGQWQRVLAAELDGPRTRTFRVQILGVKGE
jgi:secondary thiamine-phosphate synthase enzyme